MLHSKSRMTVKRNLAESGKVEIHAVANYCMTRANHYYESLIDRSDPQDPLLKLAPFIGGNHADEFAGREIPGAETEETGVAGTFRQGNTVWLTVPECAEGPDSRAAGFENPARNGIAAFAASIDPGLSYIAAHREIRDVRLSGCDSLSLSTPKLGHILQRLGELEHVNAIRLQTSLPVHYPMRIYKDAGLQSLIRSYATAERTIYAKVMIHHPRELTAMALRSLASLQQAGAVVVSQTPLWKGVNDDPEVMEQLLESIVRAGIVPYGLYVRHPEAGEPLSGVPLARAYRILEQCKERTSGLGKQIRLILGGLTGEIEVMAIENGEAYLKHLVPQANGETFVIRNCPEYSLWFEEHPDDGAFEQPPSAKWTDRYPIRIIGD